MFNFSYIGAVNSSAKIAKGKSIGLDTFVVYLAAADLSGYNTCPKATASCAAGCLMMSGRVIMDKFNTITTARINKTRAFYEHRPQFMAQLVREIKRAKSRADQGGRSFAVRLNGTSDISPMIWKHEGRTLMEIFPEITFYDYSKVLNRIKLVKQFKNYDLTFSYSGENWDECEQALKSGVRVAVVFKVKKGQPLPASFRGFHVIDGDLTDYRPDDPSGCIVGLRFKRIKDKEAQKAVLSSPFVIDPIEENQLVNI